VSIGHFTFTHLMYLVQSIGWTLVLSAIAFALGAIGGFGLMLARISPRPWLRWLALVYIECIQGIPLLILLFIVYFGLSVYGLALPSLIAAGIGRVVASLADPNPLVAGQGFERLRAAGVAVEVGPGAEEARELNLGFLSRMVRKTPWVRMKVAASLDGRTGLANGVSQWITAEAARADVHHDRAPHRFANPKLQQDLQLA